MLAGGAAETGSGSCRLRLSELTREPLLALYAAKRTSGIVVNIESNATSIVPRFDCSLRLVDVEEGKEIRVFKEDQAVQVIKFNPSNSNLFLSGGSKGSLRIWDIRSGLVTKEYHRSLGTILDIEFNSDGKQFISSTDTTRSNISENSIIIWDALRQVPLSN